MNEENFFVSAVGACFVVAVLSVSSCTAANVHTRAEAAKAMQAKGADPLDIPCAIGDGTERYCELRAATKALTVKGENNE